MKGKVNTMNEFNFEVEEIKDENAQPENMPQKQPKKRTALKIAASLMAMVMVSAGSIAVYSQLESGKTEPAAVIEETSAQDQTVEAEKMGLIRTEEHDPEALSTEDIVEKVLPSVVGIESKFTITENTSSMGGFFGFGGDMSPRSRTATGTGTGVVVTENGYIVTNAHVIYDSENGCGLSEEIKVLLNDEKSYDAEVIGYDTACDLAVLKIMADGLTPVEFGDSDSLRLGESVVAIGNPLGFELKDTVTRGIISGINRSITINDNAMNLLQTDAAINSGNSGGPLINKYGQVIGINSSKMSSSYYSDSASIEGIGFAIPSNEVATIVDDLMKYGYVTGKPQLGISCQSVTETISKMYDIPVGVYIVQVTENGAADRAGLRKGDVITAVDGVEVTSVDELNAQKNLHTAGEKIELTVIRNGEEMTVKAELDEAKAENN